MGEIRIGTSGWHYPTGAGTWNGVFYPARRGRGFDELAYYAEHFDTVELNSTFYRMPEAAMTTGWLRRTPESFLFSVKLYQKFTHPDMYLAREGVVDWDLSRVDFDLFKAGIAPMAERGRLAAVLAQFPSSFHANADALAYLEWLLGGLAGYPVAVELRHKSWSEDAKVTQEILDAFGAAWALIDEPKFQSSIRQDSDITVAGSSSLMYVRFHGRNAATWWEHDSPDDRYNYLYSPGELLPFARTLGSASAAQKKVLAYFNNHFSAKAVANAAVLKHDLGQLIPGTYSEEMVSKYPELEGIVHREQTLL